MPAIPAIHQLDGINNIHHSAFRCRDAAQTTHFYRDILGLELQAALAFKELPGSKIPQEFMHLFFKMKNGEFIAFFDSPDNAKPEMFTRRHGFELHIAFEVPTKQALLDWQQYLKQYVDDCMGPINHEFVHSIYTYDPNGIQIEFTYKDKQHDKILHLEHVASEENLLSWTEKTRQKKISLFGEEALKA